MSHWLRVVILGFTVPFAGAQFPAAGSDRAAELGTKFGDSEKSAARQVLAAPEKYKCDFPAFLIGVEKARFGNIGAPVLPDLILSVGGWATGYINRVTFANLPLPGINARAERTFVSHLIEFTRPDSSTGPYSATIRYSAYEEGDLKSAHDAFEVGRDRLLGIRDPLKAAIRRERPTHLIVFSTGWNNSQGDTFEGMKHIHAALAQTAAGREFRPFFLGISWPSMSENLGPKLEGTTYNVKSCDADEVGLVWASTLVNQVLAPTRDELVREGALPHRPDLIVIGHSFGARVVTWAAFCGGLKPARTAPAAPVVGPDYVIGLQGAFSIARFVAGKGVEGSPFAQRPAQVRFAYTCSDHDRAVETFNTLSQPIKTTITHLTRWLKTPGVDEAHLGVPHIGGKTAFGLQSEEYNRVIDHRSVVDPTGHLDRATPITAEKIVLIDASAVIKEFPPEKAKAIFSGAHGDIYNPGVARLIWQIIAPPSPPTR